MNILTGQGKMRGVFGLLLLSWLVIWSCTSCLRINKTDPLSGGAIYSPEAGPAVAMLRPQQNVAPVQIVKVARVYEREFDETGEERWLATVLREHIDVLSKLGVGVEILGDDRPDSILYWITATQDGGGAARDVGGDVLLETEDGRTVLARLPELVPLARWTDDVITVRAVSRSPFTADRLRPSFLEDLFVEHMRLSPRVDRISIIEDLMDDVDPATCLRLVEQLTGERPITDATGASYTMRDRHICSADVSVLSRWLAEDLTDRGLDVAIEDVSYPDLIHQCRAYPLPWPESYPQLTITIRGSDPTVAHQVFTIAAHIDAAVPPGADDNAAAVAAVVCAARELSRAEFRRTTQFVLFNGEEVDHLGSAHYVRNALPASGLDFCGAFNFDMIAWDGDGDRKFQIQSQPGDPVSEFLGDRLAETITTYALDLVPVRVTSLDSTTDAANFWRAGLPAVQSGEEYFCETSPDRSRPRELIPYFHGCADHDFNPFWHMRDDSVANLSEDVIAETAKAIIGIVGYAAEIWP